MIRTMVLECIGISRIVQNVVVGIHFGTVTFLLLCAIGLCDNG
jgi:hypothetical protein